MLKVLPSHISNLIAAGEVVQRPASVVKELMENSVDAGASLIEIIIKDSGRTLIQVIDNGCGMSPEDAKTAFLRHATSKIEEIEDLNNIHTFGFRGEALASIAAVADVVLKTRRESDDTGYEVRIAESGVYQEGEVSTPVGSNFCIRNIFYNIPARRKFLKSDAAEYRQIVSEFQRVALTWPDLSFRLTHNGNEVYNLQPANLKQRILALMGRDIGKELVDISVDTAIVKISGYIGRPEDARKSGGHQFFFVNNRFFRSPYLQKAILRAYENIIPEGTTPSFFIWFDAEPSKIDINIHPSKTEVKFEEEYAIFEFLLSGAKESLGKYSLIPSIDFDQEGAPDIPAVNKSFYVPPPKINYNPLFNPFDNEKAFNNESAFENENELSSSFEFPLASSTPERPYESRIFQEPAVSQKPVINVSGRYLLTTIKSGVLMIDIRRAKERILYDKYINSISSGNTIIQQNLFPTTITLSEESYSYITEYSDVVESLGFDIQEDPDSSATGERKLVIKGLPTGFTDDYDSLSQIIDNLIFAIKETGRNFEAESIERRALYLAKAGASGNIGQLNSMEAQLLIDSLYACTNPSVTPEGKKCMAVVPIAELDKWF